MTNRIISTFEDQVDQFLEEETINGIEQTYAVSAFKKLAEYPGSDQFLIGAHHNFYVVKNTSNDITEPHYDIAIIPKGSDLGDIENLLNGFLLIAKADGSMTILHPIFGSTANKLSPDTADRYLIEIGLSTREKTSPTTVDCTERSDDEITSDQLFSMVVPVSGQEISKTAIIDLVQSAIKKMKLN